MEKFSNENFNVWIEDNICFIDYLASNYTLEMMKEGIKGRLSITKENSYTMIADIRKLKSITREARQSMASKDASYGVTACAIIVKSKVQEVILNFFNSIYKAPTPYKLFTNLENAKKWVEQFKESK